MIKTFIHYCSSLVNHTRFQTKIGSLYPSRFQAKTPNNLDFLKVLFLFQLRASLPVFGAHPVDLWKGLQKTLPFGAAQLGGTFLYVLYKGVPSPQGGGGTYNYAGTKITLRLYSHL